MLIVTSNNAGGYENDGFREIGTLLNTNDIFYHFRNDGVDVILSNGNNVADIVAIAYTVTDKIGVLLRYSNNADAFFAKTFSYLYPNMIFDRPIEAYTTKGIPKINSELKKYFQEGANKIEWYVAFSKDTLIRNADEINYPVVYKPANGNHGRGIVKINSLQELLAVDHNWDYPMFLQEFYNKKWEYRVVAWDGEVINFARKKLKGEDGNQFGGRKFVKNKNPLMQDYIEYIRKYAKKGLVGIDLARLQDGRIIIIEENRAMEFESLDRATEKNTCLLIKEAMGV
jgi:hypothetical protein